MATKRLTTWLRQFPHFRFRIRPVMERVRSLIRLPGSASHGRVDVGSSKRHLPPLRRRLETVAERTETLAVEDIAMAPALVRPYLVAHEHAYAQMQNGGSVALTEAAVQ